MKGLCMYLRVNEQHYIASLDQNYELELFYIDTANKSFKDRIVINQYVCLFNDDYSIVDEVFVFLENRLRVKRLAFNTVATKGSDLKLFYDFLRQYNLQYSNISKNHINDFIAWLMQPEDLKSVSKRTAKSVNRILSSIKDFYTFHSAFTNTNNPFKYATEIIKHPSRRDKGFYAHTHSTSSKKSIFKIKEYDKGIRVLSKEQIKMILNSCTKERDRLLFELLLFTGMRIGEALSLDIHSIGISCVGENVQALPLKQKLDDHIKGSRYRQQKSGPRELFIPTPLMKKLSAYYESVWLDIYSKNEMEHEFFFISEFHNNLGAPLSYQAVWDRCRKIGKVCGVLFTPHDFRHTFATTLARNNVGIDRLQKLLGHRDISSTEVYIQIANKEEIVEELIPFYENYGVSNG